MKEGLIYDIMVDVNKRPEGWNKELYDKLSYDFRIECAKNGEIEEWNQVYEAYLRSEWERVFPLIECDKESDAFKIFPDGKGDHDEYHHEYGSHDAGKSDLLSKLICIK